MKRKVIFLPLLLIMALMLSCNKTDNEYYSLGKIWISMGLVDTINTMGYDFVIYTDNGDTLLPATNAVKHFDTYNNQRVIVNYTKLGDMGDSSKVYYVKINNLNHVLYKQIVTQNEINDDSLGFDPVNITEMWTNKNMLNIEFSYWGEFKTHFINLELSNNDFEHAELVFRHNSQNDNKSYYYNAIVTFNLDNIKIEGQNERNYIIKWTDYNDEEHQMNGTFQY